MADFVAVGDGGIVTSEDGQTWTRTYDQASMRGIGWSEGLGQYLAVFMEAATSPDGATWTVQPGFPLGQANTPLWISELGLWVCGGSYGSIATSPDAVTWEAQWGGFASSPVKEFAWSPELGLLVGVAGSHVYTSADAVTWSAGYKISTSLQSGVNLRSVVWCAELGVFITVGDVGVIATSPDGVTWSSDVPLGSVSIYRVTWSPELAMLVAVGVAGLLATSPDGVTWTRRTNPYGGLYDDFWGVDWSSKHGIFVAVGRYAHIATSPDGITWEAAPQPLSGVITYFDVTVGPSAPPYTGGLMATRRAFVG